VIAVYVKYEDSELIIESPGIYTAVGMVKDHAHKLESGEVLELKILGDARAREVLERMREARPE
jgi:hypothetical protein